MPGSGLKVCGGWWVSKPILVFSLKSRPSWTINNQPNWLFFFLSSQNSVLKKHLEFLERWYKLDYFERWYRPSRPPPTCGWNYPHCCSWPQRPYCYNFCTINAINHFTFNRVWVSSWSCLPLSAWYIGSIKLRAVLCDSQESRCSFPRRKNVTQAVPAIQ